jgi:predicted transcriptional regulator
MGMTDKEIAIEAIRRLPERVSFQEIAEEVAVLATIGRGEEDAGAGRTTPHDDVKQRLRSWLAR